MRARLLGVGLFALAVPGFASAQWSTDAAANLAVGDRSGEQAQPKIRPTPDGGCWISWFDNAAGGYDVYVQRLDAAGAPQLPHNGVLVKDRGFSSTQDYDLRVDADGNAVIVFRDDQAVPGTVQITVQKVAPDGQFLWGPAGATVSTGSADKNNPKCAVLSDGHVVVGWSGGSPSAISLQRLDPTGALQLPAPAIFADIAATVRPLQISDIQAGSDGSCIVLGVRCSGSNCVTSNKHLHAQKFDAGLAPLWDRDPATVGVFEPVIVFDATSIQTGTFPAFLPDGAGGAVFGWYETGASRRAYVQRLSPSGGDLFPHNGIPALTTAGILQISAGLAFDPATGDALLAIKTANATQSQWGLRAQRITAAGARAWSDDGVQVLPFSPVQTGFERALARGDGGADLVWFENSGNPARVLTASIDAHAGPLCSAAIIDVCSVASVKSRLDVARGSLGNTLAAWADSRNGPNDIFAQSILPGGRLGGPADACPADFNHDGQTNADDLSDYITFFFNSPPCSGSDFNRADGVNADDLSDYITTFFASPC